MYSFSKETIRNRKYISCIVGFQQLCFLSLMVEDEQAYNYGPFEFIPM